ncbi:hypothetical protein KUCAC02_014441, partial [Chaenocephalus aceratus]
MGMLALCVFAAVFNYISTSTEVCTNALLPGAKGKCVCVRVCVFEPDIAVFKQHVFVLLEIRHLEVHGSTVNV